MTNSLEKFSVEYYSYYVQLKTCGVLKGPPSMAASEFGGVRLRITAYSQNLREHECSNQTSGIRGTLVRQAKLGTSYKVKVLVG